MKSIEQFQTFINENLRDKIEALRKIRLRLFFSTTFANTLILGLIIFIAIRYISIFDINPDMQENNAEVLVFAFGGSLILILIGTMINMKFSWKYPTFTLFFIIAFYIANRFFFIPAMDGVDVVIEQMSALPLLLLIYIAAFIPISIIKIKLYENRSDFHKRFKTDIISAIIRFIDENLVYEPYRMIDKSVFVRSRIFTNSVDRYSGDDYIRGTIGQTRIEFSEVSASEVTKDSKGNETVNRFFWGIFFIGDFNKEFKGQTYVFPDKAERMFGSVARFFQSMDKSRGQLMHLDDPDFEKLFKVYSTDQIESRYILTHSLMQRLINFQMKSKHSISIGFINSNIYIAIPKNRDLLEPRRWGNPVTDKALYEYFEDLSIAISIVEELNLNLRIWTK